MIENVKLSPRDLHVNNTHLSQSNPKNRMDASPSIKSYRDRNYFSKIAKTRSDRELSFSRKSFDCLINEQNEANSNSSNECNIKDQKETNIDRDCTDENINCGKKLSQFSLNLYGIKLDHNSNDGYIKNNNESNRNESSHVKNQNNKDKASDIIVPMVENSHISIPNITLDKIPSIKYGTASEPKIIKNGFLSQNLSVNNC